MKPQRKNLMLNAMVNEASRLFYDLVVERPKIWFAQLKTRLENLPKTNFDLGCSFAETNKWWDAIFRFRIAAYFDPNYPQVWYNLGCSYFHTNRLALAKTALLKALAQNPAHAEAIFMLASMDPSLLSTEQLPRKMPTAMITDFFDRIASGYDVAEARAGYQAPKVIHTLAATLLKNPHPSVLDLACGTGIAARPWRAIAKEMIGIDLSPAMLELAKTATQSEQPLFDHVFLADMAAIPVDITDTSIHLAQCINSAHFMGDLGGLMQNVSRVLHPEGIFILTIEPHTGSVGFTINPKNGKFCHAPDYVKQAAKNVGLTCIKESAVQLYPEITTHALIFSKSGS